MSLQSIFEDVKNERAYQEGRWGNGNDDRNTLNDWGTYICRYYPRPGRDVSTSSQRRRLVQVAALAVAAIESLDRNCGFPEVVEVH